MKLDGKRFHHATQNDAQLKTHESFTYGIFHLILLGWLKTESEMVDKGGPLYMKIPL